MITAQSHSERGNIKIKRAAIGLLLASFVLLTGCAAINTEGSIKPTPDTKWKYSLENYSRNNMVEYDCSSFKVKVWEVSVRWKTYFIGPILPIIPIFQDLDYSKEHLAVEVGTTGGPALTYDDLSAIIITDDKNQVHTSTRNEQLDIRPGAKLYRVGFDIRRDKLKEFHLGFLRPVNNCLVAPVSFKKFEKSGLKYWKPGP